MSVANGSYTRTNNFDQGEAKAYPRFFVEPVEDPLATANAGRSICRDEERVEIILPGNPLTRPVQAVNDGHRSRWPDEYKRFKDGLEMSPDGSPLEQWPLLKRSQVMELKALGFATVEQIASMDDQAVQRIGLGGRRLRELAVSYLDEAAASALATQLTADNEKKDGRIALLERQVGELGELVSRLHGELQGIKNAPNPISTVIPGMVNPLEQARQMQGPADQGSQASSLDALPAARKRRPAKDAAA